MLQPSPRPSETHTIPALDNAAELWQVADIRQALQEADQGLFATQYEVVATFAKFDVRYGL